MEKHSTQEEKLLMMGGMFENIIHQFKQPLNAINTEATGLKFQKEMGMLSDKEFEESLNGIIKSTEYLSNTIDDFRNFLREDKKLEYFHLDKNIELIESIIKPILKAKGIEIIKDFKTSNLELYGYPREFAQVIINILNNAKDAILLNESYDKIIYIEVEELDDSLCIKIHDNGGGIPDDVLPKIFDSHFTTKEEIGGTGIGLHMSKIIINDHFKGNLKATNATFTLQEKEQQYGACFEITVPKSN
jgi:signal transduction histidine kinase